MPIDFCMWLVWHKNVATVFYMMLSHDVFAALQLIANHLETSISAFFSETASNPRRNFSKASQQSKVMRVRCKNITMGNLKGPDGN